jgi:glycosyltransferase involved in cell wall biosynthesis
VGTLNTDTFRNKGVPELLEALSILQNRCSIPVVLHLLGDGSARDLCESQAISLGVEDRCYFEGQKSRNEIREWLYRSDALVVASHIESFGVVLIEAMACGIPVVATRCGGPEDVVTPETGILVESGSSEALADGIQHLLENYFQYDPQRILSFVEDNFFSEKVCVTLLDLYEKAIQ